jgi:hypothetical protein
MRVRWLTLALVLAGTASTAAPPAHFEPLAFLAGHCWRGTFPDGKSRDTHCYAWALGGAHLRDTHAVCGEGDPYLGETFYSWDPEAETVAFRYFNSLGGVSEGHLEFGPDGIRSPEERYVDERGEQVLRSTIVPVDAAHYRARTEQRVDGRWVEAWTVEFTRVESEGDGCSSPSV